ncbi:DUF72 domain-containing protein [Pedobacter sp. MC2016-14]|uniref:DUF72 domain-containing protein n=1 Tax=Pedobacter sp. MC2016-14 TaxID=2897327 RepID=UPI001E65DDC8|nr:DUF72 domain-containing protein [Pedobacter sp. MC2016-14]MCD0490583.1 DUF72 domain-containing protein [Pedobacter sp. MC2016-14]
MEIKNYYSGTSGLLLPVRNKLSYPEEFKAKSRLCFYSSMMNSIEINSSFYKVPMAATVKKWSAEVPVGFKFTFKLFREITHNKGLAFDPDLLKNFMDVISNAAEKKGCLLVQFPPSVRIGNIKQLAFLMDKLVEFDPERQWNVAMEFRHGSLYQQDVYNLLEEHQIGMVIQDKPPAITPIMETELPFVYLRFHGPGGSYRGSYETELLEEYADYIRNWLDDGKTVYTYFNNTMGEAVSNLFTLQDLLREKSIAE